MKKRKRKTHSRKTKTRLIFTLVTFFLFFGIFEIGVRVRGFEYQPFLDAKTWWGRFEGQPIFIADPYLFWRLRPNANKDLDPKSPDTQRVNSRGFRDDEFKTAKKPGELRAITMGDSCTFGDGVANWLTYAQVLEKNLGNQMPGKQVSVINAGVPGYTSHQILTYLQRELIKLKPDLVTVYAGFNDNVPAADSIPDNNRTPRDSVLYSTFRVMRNLRSVQLIEFLVNKYVKPIKKQQVSTVEGHQTFRVPMDKYVENLCTIKDLGDKQGYKTIIMTLPHAFPYESERNPFVRKAAQQCGIPMIDLFHEMKKYQHQCESLYNSDGGHPNPWGHHRIAELIQAKMAELGMAPAPTFSEGPPNEFRLDEAICKKQGQADANPTEGG